jgi:hypothetical protein
MIYLLSEMHVCVYNVQHINCDARRLFLADDGVFPLYKPTEIESGNCVTWQRLCTEIYTFTYL